MLQDNFSAIELNTTLQRLRQSEREIVAQVIHLLSETDKRRSYLELAYPSLFEYCTRGLGYSESAAFRRISVARCVHHFPELLTALREGKINLTTGAQVAPSLSSENCTQLITQISGKTQEEVKVILAPFTNSVAKPVEQVKVMAVVAAPKIAEQNSNYFRKKAMGTSEEKEVRYELRFSVKEECKKKLDRVRVQLSSKFPKGASLEEALSELIDSYLEKSTRAVKTRAVAKGSNSRHIPAAVRREVYQRDHGCCTYVSPEGVKCGSSWDVEIDHVQPFGCGGDHSPDNLRVLCRAHNMMMAEITYGPRAA